MIRTTSHSLQFATDFKKSKLDDLFSEYQESRNGEVYLCKSCGMQMDADYNASINIQNCFLNKELPFLMTQN